jgi:spermidine synthase
VSDKPLVKPFICETLTTKSLFFSTRDVQSKMHTERPYELQFDYTKIMMGFLQLIPQPRSIAMIGLGGGSLAKFCYRYLPDAHITVIEINPDVLALRDIFCIPADDHRFTITLADAADFVRETEQQFDVLLADGFDEDGLPEPLSTQRFYDDCHDILTPGGVMVSNLHRCNALFDVYLNRMQTSFTDPLLQVNDPGATNCLAFGYRGNGKPQKAFTGMQRPTPLDPAAWAELVPSMARVFLASREQARNAALPL